MAFCLCQSRVAALQKLRWVGQLHTFGHVVVVGMVLYVVVLLYQSVTGLLILDLCFDPRDNLQVDFHCIYIHNPFG